MQSRPFRNASLEQWQLVSEFLGNGTVRHYHSDSNIEEWQRSQRGALGRGAYGEVWSEVCVSDPPGQGRVRAVKKIPETHRRFTEKELEALVAFSTRSDSHFGEYRRYLVQFFGWFRSTNDIFIAMELVPHRSLQEYVSQTAFTEPEVATITVQIGRALQLIHGMGFAHRDLKPANILVARTAPFWWVKVADFGIAKSTQGTRLNTMAGTFEYMAPEVDRGNNPDSQAYSLAVDIWSLGAVIFCLGTQNPPFRNLREAVRFAEGIDPFPKEALANFSPGALDLILQAMNGDPIKRPTSGMLLKHPWLQPFGSYVDRMFGESVYSFEDQKEDHRTQQRSWNGAASNQWTEPAQGPRSQQQTVKPYTPASNSFVRPHGTASPAQAWGGPASNAWSTMDSRTATRFPDSGQQQTLRAYNPTSEPAFRPYVPAPQARNDIRTSRLDAPDHGIRAWSSSQDLRGAGVPPPYRQSTPNPPYSNGPAFPAENGPDKPSHWLPQETERMGFKHEATLRQNENEGSRRVRESPGENVFNRANAPSDSANPRAVPPPGRRRTDTAKNPRFPNCTQQDCKACLNDWTLSQCLRCGQDFKDPQDRSRHLFGYGHFVDPQTHQPEYYNSATGEWVPIQLKQRGKPRQEDGRARKGQRSSRDAVLPAWIFNKETGHYEPNRDVTCLTCRRDFPNSHELHAHLAQRQHYFR